MVLSVLLEVILECYSYQSFSRLPQDRALLTHNPFQNILAISSQDEPAGSTAGFVVTASKPGQAGGCCMRCHYIHRGSFKTLTLPDLVSKLREHQPLRDKWLECMKQLMRLREPLNSRFQVESGVSFHVMSDIWFPALSH